MAQSVRTLYSHELVKGAVLSITNKSLSKARENAVDTSIVIVIYNRKGETSLQQIRKHYDARYPYKPLLNLPPQEWDVKFTYFYSKSGKVNKVIADWPRGQHTLLYNSMNELYEDRNYNHKMDLIERSYNSYDKNGNILKIKFYNSWNQHHMRQEYKYDSSNLLMEETVSNIPSSSFKYRYGYVSFDTHGNWTKRLRFLDDEKEPDIELREIKYAE